MAFIVAFIVFALTLAATAFTFKLDKNFRGSGTLGPDPGFPLIVGGVLTLLILLSHWFPIGW